MNDAEWIEVGKTTETDGKTYRWLMCPHCGQVKLAEMENTNRVYLHEPVMRGDTDDKGRSY